MFPGSRAFLVVVLGMNGLVGTRPAVDPYDAVAPSIAVSGVTFSRLGGMRNADFLRLRFVIRDDVATNPVGYTVVVRRGVVELAQAVGTTASGIVSLALRIRPLHASPCSIRVAVAAVDPAGNRAALVRSVELPGCRGARPVPGR